MHTRNTIYRILTIVTLFSLLLSSVPVTAGYSLYPPDIDIVVENANSPQTTLLYDHFDTDGVLDSSLWGFGTNGNGSWTISDSILNISGGTVNGAGGWVDSNGTYTFGAEYLSLEMRVKVSASDGGYWGFWSYNGYTAFTLDSITGLQAMVMDTNGPKYIDIFGVDVTTWHIYRIEVTGTTARFYVDDALKATHATDVPQNKSLLVRLSRVSWGQNQTVSVDYVNLWEGVPDNDPPAAIDDLTATPGDYPGDIVLSWTAPGDDGNTGTASLYEVRQESVLPIETKDDWEIATVMEGAPTPLGGGTTQVMTVSLMPGGTSYFAVRARDDAGNWSDLSNSPSAKAPGRLVSDINWELAHNPDSILDEEVTVLVVPVRTDDWTLGIGDYRTVIEIVQFFRHLKHALLVKGGLGSFTLAVKAVLGHAILDNWFQMRAQLVWGLHKSEPGGDPALLIWDPGAPLMDHGVPYVVTGVVRKKIFADLPTLKDNYFYYLEVEHSSDRVIQKPSATHPHFPIPAGYAYQNWEDIHLDGITGYGDQICTIGMVTERYPLDGYHYVRIQLMERLSGALVVRVPTNEEAPDMGAMALFCGTKQAAGGDDLHPGWLPIAKYLNATTGQGDVQLLQGTSSMIVLHERRPTTLFGIEIGSPADIHVYDPEGNHVGAVYDSSGDVIRIENEIPDAEYFYGTGDTPEFMSIGNPAAGTYTVTVHGTDAGTYTQTLRIYDSSGEQTYTSTLTSQPTSAGQEDTIVVDKIPSAPTGLEINADSGTVNLDWDDNTDTDLAGYNVYRSNQSNGIYQKLNDSLLSVSSFIDSDADNCIACYYYVTAQDADHNESGHLEPVMSGHRLYLSLVLRQY